MDPNQFWAHAAHESAFPSAPADGESTATAVIPGAPEAAGGPAVSPPPSMETGAPQEQEHGESTVDYEARLREEQAARQAAEAEAKRLQGTFQQVQQGLEQFAAQQQRQQKQAEFEQKRAKIYDDAQSMSPQQAFQYIRDNENRIYHELQSEIQQIEQRSEQRVQEVARRAFTPLFYDELIKQHGLPPEAKRKLERLGDPDLAARYAPELKEEFEQINKLQQQINQLSRTQRAGALQSAGLGAVGGVQPTGGAPMQQTGDPDTDAMLVLAALRNGTYTASR